jgi:hypothetical protein
MRTLALAILGVAVATAFLVWVGLRVFRDVERLQRDPKLRRRRLFLWGFLYACSSVFAIVQVATGKISPLALIGLPIAAAFIWTFLKAASNVKLPPP